MANTIAGTIYDPWGRPVAGVPLSMLSAAQNYYMVSGADGTFSQAVTGVLPYTLSVGTVPVYNEAEGHDKWCGAKGSIVTPVLSSTVTVNVNMSVI